MSQPQLRQTLNTDWQESTFLPWRRCRSLPLSPELMHKEYSTFGDLSSTVGRCDPSQLGAEVRQKLLSSSKYGVSEIPPFQAKSHRLDSPPSVQEEEMDCFDGLEPQDENGFCPVKNTVEEPEFRKHTGQTLQDSRNVEDIFVQNVIHSEVKPSEVFMSYIPSEDMEVEDETQRNMPSTRLESSKLYSVNTSSQLGREVSLLEVVDSDTSNQVSSPSSTPAAVSEVKM